MTNRPITTWLTLSPWRFSLLIACLYFLGAKTGVYGSILVEGITIIWPPNAILLAALLVSPYRHWLWILPGILIAEIIADMPTFSLTQAIAFGLINIFECTLAAWLLRHFSKPQNFSFLNLHNIALFGVAVLGVASGFAAILGASVYTFTTHTDTQFLTFWRIWWFGDALGLLIITPLLLSWFSIFQPHQQNNVLTIGQNHDPKPAHLNHISHSNINLIELSGLITANLILSIAIFSQPESLSNNYPIGPILLVPMFIWAATRLGLKGATLLSFIVALTAIYFTMLGLGPFSQSEQVSETLHLQEFLAALTLSSITLAALLNEINQKTTHLRLLDRAISSLDEGVTIAKANDDHAIVYVNKGFEKLTGYRAQEAIGKNPRFLQAEALDQSEARQQIQHAFIKQATTRVLLKNQRKDGSYFWNDMIITPVKNDANQVTHFIGIQHDITERINAEKELKAVKNQLEEINLKLEQKVTERTQALEQANEALHHLASTDSLTGVANRRTSIERAQQEFERAQRYQKSVSFIMCDLDWFKRINDNYGHAVGDQTLQTFVQTILKQLRPSDLLSRVGGEEFLILLPETNPSQATELAQRLCNITTTIIINPKKGTSFSISASFGVASLERNDRNAENIINRADKALYNAKEAGRNQVAVL